MTLELTVLHLACPAWLDTMTKAIKASDPAAIARADLRTKLINIETQATETAIKPAIAAAGYTLA